jgi:hypothetical protein
LRWYRLMSTTVPGWQVSAGADLASLTELYWRLARAGIATEIVHDWLPLPEGCSTPQTTPEKETP